jgi:hypothetical protein
MHRAKGQVRAATVTTHGGERRQPFPFPTQGFQFDRIRAILLASYKIIKWSFHENHCCGLP